MIRPLDARAVLSVALVALAVVASIAAAGSVPHTHLAGGPGLYNHEHDFTTLAAVGGGAPLPAVPAIAASRVTNGALAVPPAPRPRSRPASDDASRAPPASA
jgi:hypothetical protein